MEERPVIDESREKVRFRVADLIHPHPARVLLELFQELHLDGEIVEQTNDGAALFLIVRVPGLSESVIVPLDKTQPIETSPSEPAAHI